MINNTPQSWYDMPYLNPMDPRAIISFVQLQDSTGPMQQGQFQNSSTFLKNTTWVPSPLSLSPITSTTSPICLPVAGPADWEGLYLASQWTNSHGIVRSNTQLPASVQKLMFLKSTARFQTNIYFDWATGITSTDIQLSIRDNSASAGNFLDASSGNIPVFAWSGDTFGGLGRMMTISANGPGRVNMGLRIIDNTGNWSMFEMDWNIVA